MLIHHSFHVPTKDVKDILNKKNNKTGKQQQQQQQQSVVTNSSNQSIKGSRLTLEDYMKKQKEELEKLKKKNKDNGEDHNNSVTILEGDETTLGFTESNNNSNSDSTLISILPPCSPRDLVTKSWKPWMFSFIIELMSKQLSEYGNQAYNLPFSKLEEIELQRRRGLFAYYLVRSPFYDRFIRTRYFYTSAS
eukprot:gene2522-3124_t